jgi:predicted component of type VI protein secretion system
MNALSQQYALAADQTSMTYTDDYTTLEAEHQKHHSLYDEKPDYPLILEKSTQLIQQGSGHFLVIVSFCNASLQLRQWPGWLDSLGLLNRLFEEAWPQLFPGPERLKGRVQMLDWLVQRWQDFLDSHPPSSLGIDFLQAITPALQRLQTILDKQCPGQITLQRLTQTFEKAAHRLHTEKKAREAQIIAEAQSQAEAALQANLETHSQPISQEEYLSHLNSEALYLYASDRWAKEHLQYLNDEAMRFGIFKQNRTIAWWGPREHQDQLDWAAFSHALRLKTECKYSEALLAFETVFLEQPLFLDLQYHLCDCLEALETEPSLIDLLKHECQAFYTEHPEVQQTKLNGHIPCFNKHTQEYFALGR